MAIGKFYNGTAMRTEMIEVHPPLVVYIEVCIMEQK